MPRPSSHPRLTAEACAFAFASESAFRHRIIALNRHAVGVLDGGTTEKLSSALETQLRPGAGGMSLEVLRQLRDAAWFPRDCCGEPLGVYLSGLAADYLEHGGRRIQLRSDGNLAERAMAWRWLSLFIPSHLLVAAYTARDARDPPDEAVLIVTPRLAELLSEPCAETHLHVGAGVPFGLLWSARMRALAHEAKLQFKSTPPFGDATSFHTHLLAAATVRLLLAAFLQQRESRRTVADFAAFVEPHIKKVASRVHAGLSPHDVRRGLRSALEQMWGKPAAVSVARARRIYRALVEPAPRGGRSLDAIIAADPLSAWLPTQRGLALPETRFARRALGYLTSEGAHDSTFATFFWQYQRVHCLTYKFLVEEPGTAGLDWFTRHYARISPLRGALTGLTYASALELQSRDLALAALEVRTAPADSWVGVRNEVRDLARQAAAHEPRPGCSRPEVGLVLHFIKDWDFAGRGGRRRLHADPRQLRFGCRFGAWFNGRWKQAMAVATALARNPELLLVLRGVDVANVELAQPTWPLIPLFDQVRDASLQASARLARLRPTWDVATLRATVHAGEDFRRLVEGLRRIHEPIEARLLRMGDRIGHGVALGEDPVRWADAARRVTQPAEERLDDLLWEFDRYRNAELPVHAGRLEQVRTQALRLGADLYDDTEIKIDDLVEARKLRHCANALKNVGYPYLLPGTRQPPNAQRRSWRLFHRYLTDGTVFERGQKPIRIDVEPSELEMLHAAQSWLRHELAKREITVETNPSSNLIIADYLELGDHAVFRMQPLPGAQQLDQTTVQVSVNTDNPITFASCLADEFAHLYYAMLGRDVSAEDALEWLDRARENGYRSRFTLRASRDERLLREVARISDPRTPGRAGTDASSSDELARSAGRRRYARRP